MMVMIGIKKIGKKTIIFGIEGISLSQTFEVLSQRALYDFFKTLATTIDAAIISFHQPYRNTLYAIFPNIRITIFKSEVISLFDTTLQDEEGWYSEIAASSEDIDDPDSSNQLTNFINYFYACSSRDEALRCYETWQAYIPLNNKKIYRLVRIMEFYNEEILNYFQLQLTLKNSKAFWI
ncbi:MAG: hypothetical protein AB9856_05245 [Cellulosilyticaceae bacterium]